MIGLCAGLWLTQPLSGSIILLLILRSPSAKRVGTISPFGDYKVGARVRMCASLRMAVGEDVVK